MKMRLLVYLFWLVPVFIVCNPQKKITTGSPEKAEKDSAKSHEPPAGAGSVSYLHLLTGRWSVSTMKRRPSAIPENLENVYLRFREDSTFSGYAGCNGIAGRFSVKGTGIRFGDILSTKMACDRLEQETAFLQLLQQTVSAFTVEKDKLLLRDAAGNVALEGRKTAE